MSEATDAKEAAEPDTTSVPPVPLPAAQEPEPSPRTGLLGDMLARIAESGRALIGAEEPKPLIDRAEALLASNGEVTGTARAQGLLEDYAALDLDARLAFLRALAERMATDETALAEAIAAYQADPGPAAARRLHVVSEPRSQELLRLLNRAPGGTRALVRMREDLLGILREEPGLSGLDADFQHLFGSWFNRGFLSLRRIDWDTPASILEKIIAYEAVHAITDWDDLRRRVAAPDRALFAFFHPALTDDPLIFVEVALTAEIPGAIGPILTDARDTVDPARATTAVFYSISNCQKGLRGISFGNFLIKQVVEDLRAAFPRLATFVTLSPVPGFATWLAREGMVEAATAAGRIPETDGAPAEEAERKKAEAARDDRLAALCAHYLAEAKRPNGLPQNAVARFHLGNGARLERVHACADLSPRGQAESHGVMVNYLYDLPYIEKNHEAFAGRGEIAQSSAVRRLARTGAALAAAASFEKKTP
ncbi:MAG: malonyl-CoA decarboxylase [Pseudomonadota bacterium]